MDEGVWIWSADSLSTLVLRDVGFLAKSWQEDASGTFNLQSSRVHQVFALRNNISLTAPWYIPSLIPSIPV